KLPEDRIRAALQQLEAKRPTQCPICKKPLTHDERGTHLQVVHGYLLYEGDLLPTQAVFARLWERAFQQQERHAHEELAGMYLNLPEVRKNPSAAALRYVADLENFLLGDKKSGLDGKNIPVALPYA